MSSFYWYSVQSDPIRMSYSLWSSVYLTFIQIMVLLSSCVLSAAVFLSDVHSALLVCLKRWRRVGLSCKHLGQPDPCLSRRLPEPALTSPGWRGPACACQWASELWQSCVSLFTPSLSVPHSSSRESQWSKTLLKQGQPHMCTYRVTV